jgi:hypothetical protein
VDPIEQNLSSKSFVDRDPTLSSAQLLAKSKEKVIYCGEQLQLADETEARPILHSVNVLKAMLFVMAEI